MDDLPTRGALVALDPGALPWHCSCRHVGVTSLSPKFPFHFDCEFCHDEAIYFDCET